MTIMTQSHLGWGDGDGQGGGQQQVVQDEGPKKKKSAVQLPPELAAEDQAVQDFLRILDEHRRHCEREGKYLEAETAARRLRELRQHEENRRREAMRSRQTAHCALSSSCEGPGGPPSATCRSPAICLGSTPPSRIVLMGPSSSP